MLMLPSIVFSLHGDKINFKNILLMNTNNIYAFLFSFIFLFINFNITNIYFIFHVIFLTIYFLNTCAVLIGSIKFLTGST